MCRWLAEARCLADGCVTDNGRLRTHALFCGDLRGAMRQAAAISRHVHVKYTGLREKVTVIAAFRATERAIEAGGRACSRGLSDRCRAAAVCNR